MIRIIQALIVTLAASAVVSASLGTAVTPSHPDGYKPLFEELPTTSPLNSVRPDLLDTIKPRFTKDSLKIDFESRQVTFSRFDTLTGYPLWEFHYSELGDYLKSMEEHTKYGLQRKILAEKGKKKRAASDAPLTLSLPAHLPAWATRIMGKEPPQFSITGTQKFKLGYTKRKVGVDDQIDSALSKKGEIVFKPATNLSIRGSAGRLFKFEIKMQGETKDQFLESANNQLQNIKIEYREEIPGELEDDVIQEVVVGRTSFNMPGQGLAGYSSGSNEGLFGIKVRSQIGPLSLTTIASIEQTEKEKKTINLSAGSRPIEIGEQQMQRNLYFFIDEVFRLKYLAQADSSYLKNHLAAKNWSSIPAVKTIDVYRRVPGTVKPNVSGKTYDWAFYDLHRLTGTSWSHENNQKGIFEKLKVDTDYRIDYDKGIISFNNPLSDADIIGIYADFDKVEDKGSNKYVEDPTDKISKIEKLWILKDERSLQVPGDSTYDLMMRNIYSLNSNSSTPDFAIKRKISKTEYKDRTDNGVFYAKILGLMDENNNYLYGDSKIFDMSRGYVIIPPYKKSDPSDTTYSSRTAMQPFTNPALGLSLGEKNYGTVIYDERSSSSWEDRFSMVTTNKEKQTSFSLDFGVASGTETLKIGESPLERDVDYTIDYGMGFVELISTRARSADKIEAEYQKESLFLLDKKVFLGVNGKINLPGIGRNSYFGTTAMWQLMDAKKMMPKVGTEPFDRFLFDANLELDFEPEWMTALVNAIPLVSTETPSSARFSLEAAKSKVKSSTLSGGEAYIDNFSSISRPYTFPPTPSSWFPASSPYTSDEWQLKPPVWHQYWIQPVQTDQQPKDVEINPAKRDVNNREINTDAAMNILRLVVQPYPENLQLRQGVSDTVNDSLVSKIKPWAGIMRGLSGSARNRKNDRYFEFWVRNTSWKKTKNIYRTGELLVDFGQVAEDIPMNGKYGNRTGDYEVYGQNLRPDNDFGTDHAQDSAEYWIYPKWIGGVFSEDTLRIGNSALGEWSIDPARDNWKFYDKGAKGNARYSNGTQNNIKNKSTADNEDANSDGLVFMGTGRYFRYQIDLQDIKRSKYVSESDTANIPDSGWVKIRIPVGDNASPETLDSVVNEPSWERIENVRIVWRGFDSTIIRDSSYRDTLEFTGMQFVGNAWRELVTDSTEVGRVSAAVEDSRSTVGYNRPPEKLVEKNGANEVQDYSLILNYDGVARDSSALVFREFGGSQAFDLTSYKEMRFWAQDLSRQISTSRDAWLLFRFGTNDSTYYEFKTRRLVDETGFVPENIGWNSKEGLVVDMNRFTEMKNSLFERFGERRPITNECISDENGDSLRIYTRTEQMPSLSNIRWIAFGVKNGGGSDFSGKLRINGLRAWGTADREGWALRSSIDLAFADFLKANASYKYTDADFRSMSQDVYTKGNTGMSGGAGSEMQLSKFLPQRAGVRLPVGAALNTSLTRPEIRQNSDISLRKADGKADGFADLAYDFADAVKGSGVREANTDAAEYQQMAKDYRVYTSYRKTAPSEKSLVNLTLDRLGTEYAYSVTKSENRNGVIPEVERPKVTGTDGLYHIAENSSRAHTFSLDYNLTPTSKFKKFSTLEPFKDSKSKTINRKIKSMKLNLVPQELTFDLIKMNYNREESYNSMYQVRDTNYTFLPTEKLGITHNAKLTYEPISPFTSVTFSVESKRDFESFLKRWKSSGVDNFVTHGLMGFDPTWSTYGVLNMENSRNHKTQFRLTPDFFNWLQTSANLSSSYTQGVDVARDTSYMSGGLNSGFRVETTLRPRRLFEDFSGLAKKQNGFSKAMKGAGSALDKIDFESISFTYSGDMNVNATFLDTAYLNSRLSKSAASYYAWTLGLRERSFGDIVTGKMDDRGSFGGVQNRDSTWWKGGSQLNSQDKRSTSQEIGTRTGLKLPDPIDYSFDEISLRWKRDYSIFQRVGKMDTAITWPLIRVSGMTSILKKVPAVNTHFSTMNIKSGYNYSKVVTRKSEFFIAKDSTAADVNQSIKYVYGIDPLVQIDALLKKRKIDMSYSFGLTFDTTINSVERFDASSWRNKLQSGEKHITSKQGWKTGYKLPGKQGRTIKLFRERVIEMKGDSRYSIQFDYSKTKNLKMDHMQTDTTKAKEEWENTDFSFTPRAEYDFTKNINFSAYYKLIKKLNGPEKRLNKDSEFAAELTISF